MGHDVTLNGRLSVRPVCLLRIVPIAMTCWRFLKLVLTVFGNINGKLERFIMIAMIACIGLFLSRPRIIAMR